MPELAPVPLKPRLRGVFHQWACVCSVPLGLVLVIVAGTVRARIALSVYALSLMGLFAASALYHRINWRSVTARDWMRRLDHSMIFVLIAGSYTPFAMLVLHGPLAIVIQVAVWAGALLGVGFNLSGATHRHGCAQRSTSRWDGSRWRRCRRSGVRSESAG